MKTKDQPQMRPQAHTSLSILSTALFALSISTSAAIAQQKVNSNAEPSSPVSGETRSIMGPLFSSLTRVLPLSMNAEQFSKQENRQKILEELKIMSQSTSSLTDHTKKMHGSYAFIAQSMARDVKDIVNWYQKGSYQESRYLLHQLSENCISCHVKLKDPGHAPSMQAFFKDVNLQELAPPEKARLQVALRQFDDALTTWEDLFKTWPRPSEIFAMDALTEYLKVSLRVKEDAKRPLKALDQLAQRQELPRFMAKDINAWRSSLVKLSPEISKQGDELKRGERIIRAAQKRMEYPLDRSGTVDFIVASGLINRDLATHKLKPEAESQALYLLGITETLIGRSAWLTQTDYFMEAAVRIAPKSKFAPLAYEALEHHVLLEYSGSGGTNIPDDIQSNLTELRKLIQK